MTRAVSGEDVEVDGSREWTDCLKNTGQRPTAFREALTLNILRFPLNILTDHSARSSRDGVPNDAAETTQRPLSMFANMWDITTLAVTFRP